MTKPLIRALLSERNAIPPIWLMRQAGRYLPEYRAVRSKAGSFLDLCLNPKLAAEVTLQPVRRFGFDAAILFSDILVVPHALGQRVSFEEGDGPQLDALSEPSALRRLEREIDHRVLAPIYETIVAVKQELPPSVALLGFCGAPWTVATYMIAGFRNRRSASRARIRLSTWRGLCRADRDSDRGLGELSGAAIYGRRRCRADFR